MRLIDADKLKAFYAWWEDDRQKLFDEIVDQQPTIDAVPVIRCKDCIFRKDKYCQLYIMEQHEVEDNDCCSEAERKEE